MKTIEIPYYTSHQELHVDEKNLKAVIRAKMHEFKTEKTEAEIVKEAMDNPIGTPKLEELAKGKHNVVIVTSDHTRAVPSRITLPLELAAIRKGNPDADITILIATGLHRPTTEEEQRRMFGDEIVDHEKIVVNKAFEPDQFVMISLRKASLSPISLPASRVEERAFSQAYAPQKPSTKTILTRPLPALMPRPVSWNIIRSTKIWSKRPAWSMCSTF